MKKRQYRVNPLESALKSHQGEGGGYTRNMIAKNGAIKKRDGIVTIASFRDEELFPMRINGIFEYVTEEKSCLVVHAGTHLYECDYEMKTRYEIPLAYGIEIPDRRTQGYMHEGLLWICGIGNLAVYDGEIVFGVYEYNNGYVPTTTVGICDNYVGAVPQKNESPNILTIRRKNRLRGAKHDYYYHGFVLDEKAKYGEPFTFTAKMRVKRSDEYDDAYTSHYPAVDSRGIPINAVAMIKIHTDSLTDEKYFVSNLTDLHGNPIDIKDYYEDRWSFQVLDGNRLELDFQCPTYGPEIDNIEVEYTADIPMDRGLRVTDHCALAVMDSGNSIMLLCRGGNEIIYSNEQRGFFYFPTDNKISIGQASSKIKAILPLAHNYIGVIKDEGFFRVWIDASKMGEYKVYTAADFCGAANPYLVGRLGQDYLTVSKRGVYSACEDEEGERGIGRLLLRSSNIARELEKHTDVEWLDATCGSNGSAFYIFVGDRAYVTSEDDRYYKKGKSGDEYEYRWWVFDNCGCHALLKARDTFYMGRENGDVAVFKDSGADIDTYIASRESGDFLFQNEGEKTYLTFNECLVTEGLRSVCLDSHYSYFSTCNAIEDVKEILFPATTFFKNGEVQLFKGDRVAIVDKDGQAHYFSITSTKPSECSVRCEDMDVENGTYDLYIQRDRNIEYTVIPQGDRYTLTSGGFELRLLDPDIENIYLKEERAIECLLVTDYLDLGTDEKKTLSSIGVAITQDTCTDMELGIRTLKNSYSKKIRVGSEIDFNKLDMDYFGFNPQFKRNVEMRFFERNFDYIQLTVSSSSKGELGVEEIYLNYY